MTIIIINGNILGRTCFFLFLKRAYKDNIHENKWKMYPLFLNENTYYSFYARTKRCIHFSNSRRFCKFVIHDIYVLRPLKRVSLC